MADKMDPRLRGDDETESGNDETESGENETGSGEDKTNDEGDMTGCKEDKMDPRLRGDDETGEEVDVDRIVETLERMAAPDGTTELKPAGGAIVRGVRLGRRVRPSWGGRIEPLRGGLFADSLDRFQCGR